MPKVEEVLMAIDLIADYNPQEDTISEDPDLNVIVERCQAFVPQGLRSPLEDG
jgi:hypothetical protein